MTDGRESPNSGHICPIMHSTAGPDVFGMRMKFLLCIHACLQNMITFAISNRHRGLKQTFELARRIAGYLPERGLPMVNWLLRDYLPHCGAVAPHSPSNLGRIPDKSGDSFHLSRHKEIMLQPACHSTQDHYGQTNSYRQGRKARHPCPFP